MTTATKTPQLTVEQKQNKIDALVAIPETTLKTLKIAELRELAKGLMSNVNKPRKDELLETLFIIRNERVAQLEAIALEAKQTEEARKERLRNQEQSSNATRIAFIKKVLKDIAYQDSDELTLISSAAGQAASTVTTLQQLYAPTTVKTTISDISKALQEDASTGRLEIATRAFLTALSKSFRETSDAIKHSYSLQVKQNTENNIKVNGTALVEKAISVLTQVRQNTVGVPWQDVVIALAVTTGRRSAEILSCGDFQGCDKTNAVMFSGQAKARGEDRASRMKDAREIPTLVNSELVLNGFQWLEASGKRLDDPQEVNGKYATPLKRALTKWQPIAETNELTVKSLRAIYASLCIKHFYQGNINGATAYIAKILGHNEGDMTTAHSYQGYEVV